MGTGRASRTAVLMCQGRAAAHGRILPERFSDPTALPMLRADEREVVERVRAEDPPSVYRERAGYEMVRAVAEVSVPRTLAIDDAVRDAVGAGVRQLVILGAGLDGRAWRMPELAAPGTTSEARSRTTSEARSRTTSEARSRTTSEAGSGTTSGGASAAGSGTTSGAASAAASGRTSRAASGGAFGVEVFEVDQPASQADKRARTAELTPAVPPRFVEVDFGRDQLGERLAAAGHRDDAPTTWVWEGVVAYLTPAEVAATLAELAGRSAPGSRLIVNYQERSATASIGRLVGRAVAAVVRYDSPLEGEPWRSTWTPGGLRALLARHGFTVRSDANLLTLAEEYGMPVTPHGSLRNGRVLTAGR